MKLNDLRKVDIILLLYSILKTKSPQQYMSGRFLFMSEISYRDTRQGAAPLSVPFHRTARYNKSLLSLLAICGMRSLTIPKP